MGAGLVAATLAMVSLWPGKAIPAWPAASAGIAALVLAWGRGPALPRASAAILGLLSVLIGGVQIATLWAAAFALSYM